MRFLLELLYVLFPGIFEVEFPYLHVGFRIRITFCICLNLIDFAFRKLFIDLYVYLSVRYIVCPQLRFCLKSQIKFLLCFMCHFNCKSFSILVVTKVCMYVKFISF